MKITSYLLSIRKALCLFALSFHLILASTFSMADDKNQRAVEIYKNIRCVVCDGESIHESKAKLAQDMRKLIDEKISAGDNNETIYKYFSDRYGDQILMNPPFNNLTLLLWIGPAIILLTGVFFIKKVFNNPKP